MIGRDGEPEVVTPQGGMTPVPDPARHRIPPKKEGAARAGRLPGPRHSPCRRRTLARGVPRGPGWAPGEGEAGAVPDLSLTLQGFFGSG